MAIILSVDKIGSPETVADLIEILKIEDQKMPIRMDFDEPFHLNKIAIDPDGGEWENTEWLQIEENTF